MTYTNGFLSVPDSDLSEQLLSYPLTRLLNKDVNADLLNKSFYTMLGESSVVSSVPFYTSQILVSDLPPVRHLRIIYYIKVQAGGDLHDVLSLDEGGLRTSPNDYSGRAGFDGAAFADVGADSVLFLGVPTHSGNSYNVTHGVIDVLNVANFEKLISWRIVHDLTSGAVTRPVLIDGVGKWANTSTQATSVAISPGGDYSFEGTVTVMGSD